MSSSTNPTRAAVPSASACVETVLREGCWNPFAQRRGIRGGRGAGAARAGRGPSVAPAAARSRGEWPMSILLGCIADDFTGATDLASMVVRQGLRAIQTVGVLLGEPPPADAEAVVVALKTRTIPAASAVD